MIFNEGDIVSTHGISISTGSFIRYMEEHERFRIGSLEVDCFIDYGISGRSRRCPQISGGLVLESTGRRILLLET